MGRLSDAIGGFRRDKSADTPKSALREAAGVVAAGRYNLSS
ncbi:MAG: hypothetical protein ACJAYX_003431 [Planctomycetota bacterium]|jgi:hypothetical protein